MSIVTITPRQLEALREAGRAIDLIDVRTPLEYREIHVAFARNVPLDRLDGEAVQRSRTGAADEPLYVICRSGSRGRQACARLAAAGLEHVVNVEGGTLAWAECGLPVVRGRKGFSLDRQVRLTIGALVILGVVLGWLVHPACSALAALMGAGLVYAGLADSCPLAMTLARMPWNQARADAPACRTPSFP